MAVPAAVATAAVALFQASEQQEAGAAQRRDSKTQANLERLGATQREGDRKERLLDALSSRNALAGTAGITLEGSPFQQIEQDIKREELGTERDEFQTGLKVMTGLTRGKIAKRVGNIKGTTTLVKAASSIIGGLPTGGGVATNPGAAEQAAFSFGGP